jgi:hypothetical protein
MDSFWTNVKEQDTKSLARASCNRCRYVYVKKGHDSLLYEEFPINEVKEIKEFNKGLKIYRKE